MDYAQGRELASLDELFGATKYKCVMPSMPPIQLLDTVALVCDVPDLGLVAGEVGAVVELLSDDAFKVEFVDDAGYNYGLHTLRSRQLVALHTKGHPLRGSLKAA